MKTIVKICIVVNLLLFYIALCGLKCLKSYYDENLPEEQQSHSQLPPLYIITPTYPRTEQIAEITRLGNTLKHVPNLFWLVIEDATVKTPQLTRQLHRLGVPFEHLIGNKKPK